MSVKCVKEILDRAKGLNIELSEREAGEMFRKIRNLEARYEKEQSDPQDFLSDEFKTKHETAPRGEALRLKIRRLSPEDRLTEYAKIAFEDTVKERKETLRRHYLQLQKAVAIAGKIKITDQKTHMAALNEITFSVDQRKNAIIALDMAEMSEAIDKYHSTLGYKITREDALNVVREIQAPGMTKDANARALADVWVKGREAARERKNNAGADIGKLKDWIMPQAWDVEGMKKGGLSPLERAKLLNPAISKADRITLHLKAKMAWAEDAMQHIDKEKYWDENTGKFLNDEQLREVLSYAWETITTGGLNEGVSSGKGSLAKRLGAHREIHLKSADSWYEMTQKYGEKDVFTLMTSRIQKDARDIAMLEIYGPNPNAGFKTAFNLAMSLDQSDKGSWMAQNYFEELKGGNSIPANTLVANAMLGLRQWLVAAKLGGMLLSQLNDIGTYAAIARTDGLGMGKALRLAVKSLNPANKADQTLARRQGILAQSVINDVAQRYGETVKGTKLSSRFANATIKLSGGEWWTNGMKRAYQTLIGFHLNDAVKAGDLEALGPQFSAMLERYGIGKAEWEVIRQAKSVELYGEQAITPISIKLLGDTPEIRQTALKVAEMMNEEADIAVLTPGLKERALIKGGTKPGTVSGEFMRSFALFKSFTVSMTTKVLPRIFKVEGGAGFRAGLVAQYALSMIILGGVSYQLKEIAKGRNPRDISTPEFWGAAAAQSGGLGIFGDFMFSDVNRYGGGLTSTAAGPVAGFVEDVGKLTLGNIRQAEAGKDTNMAAESIQFAKNYTPFMNLWYTRAALDHLLFYQLQEAVNPGYLRRMKSRVEKENNQSHWWNPEDVLPQSAPDMPEAFGGR